MVNKRLFIQNIISHNDECTFFDKKETVDIKSEKGKSKLLKHICALSNSNPNNESFLIIGISDNNEIIGIDFIDDADIQNITNASLTNPPKIKFENISFPNIPKDKSIGLLTIYPSKQETSFLKKMASINSGTVYHRLGSKSEPIDTTNKPINIIPENQKIVEDTYKYSNITLKELLDNIFDFYKLWDKVYNPQYIVFKDQFVVCWSGYNSGDFYNEVDIQIVNEGTRLFFSGTKDVKIVIDEDKFQIDLYRNLGYGDKFDLYPVKSTKIIFENNGVYSISEDFTFTPPIFPKNEIESLYREAKEIEKKCLAEEKLTEKELEFWEGIGNYFFICYLNGIEEARDDFYNSRNYLSGVAGLWHTECKEILEELEKVSI